MVLNILLGPSTASAQSCTAQAQTITATTSITVPTGCDIATVDVWGGGGGGGAYHGGPNRGGGGGGGGAHARRVVAGLTPGASISVTVGTGGAGGTYLDNQYWNPGANGGNSSFGAYVTATGGLGGVAGSAANAAGGTCSGADSCHAGGTGGQGITSSCSPNYRSGGGGGGGGGINGAGGNGTNATNQNCIGDVYGGEGGAGGANGGGAGGRGEFRATQSTAPAGGGGGGSGAQGSAVPGWPGANGKVIVAWSASTPPPSSQWQTSGTSLYYSAGNVGIGTSTPGVQLEVTGTVKATTSLCINSDCRTAWPTGSGPWALNGTKAFYTGGNVGIGTSDPDLPLALRVPDGASSQVVSQARKDGSGGVTVLNTRLDPETRTAVIYTDGTNNPTIGLSLGAGSHAQALNIVYGSSESKIGIGTTSPTAKLHVAGNVVVDGNIGAKYQDVAEWVVASAPALPGSVVIADPTRLNNVRPSTLAYDTAVAGVVSYQPGVLLGEAGDDKVAVAQSGRVKVKVDASSGPIAPGDLLVTSPRPGHAMRSEPLLLNGVPIHRPGTILGKALEPLEAGVDEILVLLTLQ